MTKTEIIKETAEFYNISNRAYETESGQCTYLTGDGKSCAVGRCVKPEKLVVFSSEYLEVGVSFISGLDKILSERYTGHSNGFWRDLQVFHDQSRNWDEEGMTVLGRERYDDLLAKYAE